MRPIHLLPLVSIVVSAAPPLPLEDAVAQILAAFDEDQAPESLPKPLVPKRDRPALNWLQAALREANPLNPFPVGSRFHKEAESVRTLLNASPESLLSKLATLKPTLAGSHAALWRWGQTHARRGEFSIPQRQAWEDLLLRPGGPGVIRGWALRHALCFALAEGDEARFQALKMNFGDELPPLFQSFQRAFALLDGPAPHLYLWSLPELQPLDLPLSRLGARIYISPLEVPAPSDAAWIIPAPTTNLPLDQSSLEGQSLQEAKHVAEQVRALGRTACLAPSRPPLESLALVYFPIDLRMNVAGRIQSIRMGDAALAQAKPTP